MDNIIIKNILRLFVFFKSRVYEFFEKSRFVLHVNDGHARTIALIKLMIVGAIVILFAIFIIIFSLDLSDTVREKFPKLSSDKPIFSKVKKLTLSYMDSKNNLASIFLQEAEEILSENKILVSNIDTKIMFNTNEWLKIKSENAVIDKSTSEISLKDRVFINDYKGDTLKGTNIKINIKNNVIFSDDEVSIYSTLGTISSSDGFYLKKDNKYLFKGKVKAKFDTSMFSNNKIPFRKIGVDFNKNNVYQIIKKQEHKVKSINDKATILKSNLKGR